MKHEHIPMDPERFYSRCLVCRKTMTCATDNGWYSVKGAGGKPVWRVDTSVRTRLLVGR